MRDDDLAGGEDLLGAIACAGGGGVEVGERTGGEIGESHRTEHRAEEEVLVVDAGVQNLDGEDVFSFPEAVELGVEREGAGREGVLVAAVLGGG